MCKNRKLNMFISKKFFLWKKFSFTTKIIKLFSSRCVKFNRKSIFHWKTICNKYLLTICCMVIGHWTYDTKKLPLFKHIGYYVEHVIIGISLIYRHDWIFLSIYIFGFSSHFFVNWIFVYFYMRKRGFGIFSSIIFFVVIFWSRSSLGWNTF